MLEPTEITGRLAWLGVVRDRAVTLRSEPRDAVEARFAGLDGECHGGLTRPSCSRVLKLHPARGTEIRNTRQVSILSAEELAGIAADLGLDRLDPSWLGANLVMEGIPALTTLPPASRLAFEGGAVLAVDVENGPCRFPGDVIEAERPGHGRGFAKAARGRRGVVGWVERPGRLRVGERARLHVPPQRLYAPLAPAPEIA
ncbi:MAG: MOSC domain-containing protein [Paracoccaceae bacterium]